MKKVDLTRQRFGRLLVIWEAEPGISGGRTRVRWICRCDCGEVVIVNASSLQQGDTRSCGCLKRDTLAKPPAERRLLRPQASRPEP